MKHRRESAIEVFATSVCHHHHFNTKTSEQRAAPLQITKNLMDTKKPVFIKPFSCQNHFHFDIRQKAEMIQAK